MPEIGQQDNRLPVTSKDSLATVAAMQHGTAAACHSMIDRAVKPIPTVAKSSWRH